MDVRARFTLDVTRDYNEKTDESVVVAPLDSMTLYGGNSGDYSIYQIIAAFEHATNEFDHFLSASLE